MSIQSKKHLFRLLNVDSKEIHLIIENINDYYKERYLSKKDKYGDVKIDSKGNIEKRKINPSVGRLKIIQSRIQSRILSKIDLPFYIFGGAKKKDNVKNAKQHQGKKYKFVTDLRNYFPSINNKEVYRMFVRNKFSTDVASILTKLVTLNGSIPQGAPTSTTLANLVFIDVGNKIDIFCKKNGIIFTAFVDDLSFSSKEDFKHLIPFLIKIVSKKFLIHHKKTFYCSKCSVTGVIVNNNNLSLPNYFYDKLYKFTSNPKRHEGLKLYINKVNYISSVKNKKIKF